jgi:GT2 family glycosyltransferase
MIELPKKVAVIIVTYNGMQWINLCLSSLPKVLVIVVDNNSTDGTQEFIKQYFPEIVLVPQATNFGFGKANNIGMKMAIDLGMDYVFLLNQDAYMEKGTLEKLVDAAEKNPEFGIISPIHLNGDGTKIDYKFSTYIAPNVCKKLYSDIYMGALEDKVYEALFLNAAAWLLPLRTLITIGGFNPSFFHYSEDINYVERLRFHSLKIGVYPHARIMHDRDDRLEKKEASNTAFERFLTIKLSNPNKPVGTFFIKFYLFSHFMDALYSWNKQEMRNIYFNFLLIRKLNVSKIKNNRNKSMKKGPTFL